MEGSLANYIVTDGSGSSETADLEGTPEHLNRGSQCPMLSLPASVSSDQTTLAFEGHSTHAERSDSTPRPYFNSRIPGDHFKSNQPLTAHVTGSPEVSQSAVVDHDSVDYPTATSGFQWRPTYLRRRILVVFSVVFLLMIVALELLSAMSARNDGIAKGFNKDHYLWTYGPTASLTLIAALFNRVEHQAKMMAPWESLSRHAAPARKTLLVDYVSALQPVAICESLRNKDFAVAATTTVSVLIKLLIILSSGLITLSRVGVHHATMPMKGLDAFIDDDSLLRAGSSFPCFVMEGLIEGSGYPQGVSDKFAFQSVKSQLPDTAQFQVLVDGLTTSLRCEPAMLTTTVVELSGTEKETSITNLAIASPGCDVVLTFNGIRLRPQDTSIPYQLAIWRMKPVQCQGTTDDAGKRVSIMLGLIEWFANETIPIKQIKSDCTGRQCNTITNFHGTILKSAQLLCVPTYEITKVNVVQNGTEVQSVTSVESRLGESPTRTLDHVNAWSFMEAYLYAFLNAVGYNDVQNVFNTSQGNLSADPYMRSLLKSQLTTGIDVSSLYDPNFIQAIATTYFQQVGAIIAKYLLLKPAYLNTTGSAIIMEDRLVVRGWAVQWMVGMIAICMILSILTAFVIPGHGILPRSPSTLPGVAKLVSESPHILQQLRFSGDSASKTLDLQLEGFMFQSEVVQHPPSGKGPAQQQFLIKDVALSGTDELPHSFHQSQSTHSHPWILHPASRLGLGAVLVALVITLEMTLHQSRINDGLGSVGDVAHLHYTWTSVPALVFGVIAIVISSIDFTLRSLAPYTSLSSLVAADAFRTLDFLDMSVPSAIIKEVKIRNIGALATTTTMLVASFFTIFSGSLFQSISFPSTTTALLRAITSFELTNNNYTYFGINAGLILLGNLSYPSFTYEDLAFPQLSPMTALRATEFSNTSLLHIKVVVPALRSHLECRSYDKGMIRPRIEHVPDRFDTVPSPKESYLTISVNDEQCHYRNDSVSYNARFGIFSNTSYFGVDATAFSPWPRVNFQDGCSDYLFIWGKVDPLIESKIEHIAAMGCNQSIEVVDVETNFIGADLAIDMENPPRPLPNTERNSPAPVDSGFIPEYLFRDVPDPPPGKTTSNFFASITQSRWAIPLSILGGGNDDAVVAAIKFHLGVYLAQALDKVRVPAAETNATLTREQAFEGESDAERTFEATVVDNVGRRRVVQDAVSTRVLEALLILTLVLLGVGWVSQPKTNVLPKRSPTTIASAVALLAGGNLEEWVHEMDGDSTGAGGGRGTTKRFWMGWGNVPDEEGILMGNENENGMSRFGIFAVDCSDET